MGIKRQIIKIDETLCNGCGQCVSACAEGAIQLVNGKAKLVSEFYCDGLGACIGDCPTGALTLETREADPFDAAAVEVHLQKSAPPVPHQGCPSAKLNTTSAALPEYGNWPIQIRLLSADAPFFENADLLVAADCVPARVPGFVENFAAGKVVMIGCPKFDNAELYIDRFAEIFAKHNIRSVTCLVMEVPCCQGLPMIVSEGMALSGKQVPLEKVVVGIDGEIRQSRLVKV